jgi:hypothetical protein
VNRFKISFRTQTVGATLFYHVRLMARRAGEWTVCGVLRLQAAEWAALEGVCELHDMEVIDEKSLPANIAKTPETR